MDPVPIEGVDSRRLGRWMDEVGLPMGPITDVEQIGGGTQNILLRFRRNTATYVLRRPPVHKRPRADETMLREARLLTALAGSSVPHPVLIATCADEGVLGAAFYLMEAVDGVNPAVGLPPRFSEEPGWRREFGLAVADAAAAIGALDYVALGLADFGKPEGYLERQVGRWRAQLESYALLPGYSGPEIPGVEAIGSWLEDHRPATWTPGLIHGDYHLANVLARPDSPRVAAVVDWELATIGDPLVDLGCLLATWPGPEGPRPGTVDVQPWEGFPSAADLVARYKESSNRDVDAINWYEVLACFKLGIILEGSHARACAGLVDREMGDRLHASALGLLGRASARIAAA